MITVSMSTSRKVSADSLTPGATRQTQRLLGRRADSVVSLDWKQKDTTERVRGTVDATAVVKDTTMCLTRTASAEKAARMIGIEREVQHAVPDVKEKGAHHAAIMEDQDKNILIVMRKGEKEVLRVIETGTIGETTAVTVIVTREEVATGITTTATEDQDVEYLM